MTILILRHSLHDDILESVAAQSDHSADATLAITLYSIILRSVFSTILFGIKIGKNNNRT